MNSSSAILVITLIIIAFALGPIISIWSVNTLFDQINIEYSFKTWAASAWFFGLILSGRTK